MAAIPTTQRPADRCRDELPPCPVCAGLECLCRPRFFPGQLLSDEDLNRLQRYVIGKNKLHNRHLHGWGVACGLEVVCDPCKPKNVVVRTGYALSPCGDDIVLCGDQSVNVCELIARCREREPVCEPPYQAPPQQCLGGTEEWVLAVCYDETPSRGVTALTGAGDSSCGCGGTCSGGAGCGCGGKSSGSGGSSCGCGGTASGGGTGTKSKVAKSRRPQCEPTQICEGFKFTVYKLPATESRLGKYPLPYGNRSALMSWMYGNRATLGPLLDRVLCCLLAAMDLRAQIREGRQPDGSTMLITYGEYVEALREFARDFALHDCAALQRMTTVITDAQQFIAGFANRVPTAAEQAVIGQRLLDLDNTWINLVAECFCSALLPACPEPATDNCVPLALITLQKRDCRVEEICNWRARKLLITWPTVSYWLSWLPWHRLREWVARLCCGDTRSSASLLRMLQVLLGAAAVKTRASVPAAPTNVNAARMSSADAAAFAAATNTAPPPVPPDAEFAAAMASPNLMQHLIEGFEKMMAGTDREAPQWAALAARLMDGRALAPLAGNAAVVDANVKDLASHLGVTKLQKQVSALEAVVAEQRKIIDALEIVSRK